MSTTIATDSTAVISFNSNLVTFCQGSDFKTYVRQAINDEFFWRDLLGQLKLSETIETKISNKLHKLPSLVKTELEKTLPDMMQRKFMEYVMNQLPGQITKEMNSQLPTYLNNNYQMQTILEKHKESLSNCLEIKVKEILNRIVNDPTYQEITNTQLSIMDQKTERKLREMEHTFNQDRENIRAILTNDMQTLQQSLAKVDKLQKTLNNIQTTYTNDMIKIQKKHEQDMSGIWMFTGVFFSILGFSALSICYLASRNS